MSRTKREDLQAAVGRIRAALNELERLIGPASNAGEVMKPIPSRRELCIEILKERPGLTVYEIMDEMRNRGYRFTSLDPVNSVRAMLYRGKEFVRVNGRFALKK